MPGDAPAMSFSDHLRVISRAEASYAADCAGTAALADVSGWPDRAATWRTLEIGHLTQSVRYAALAEDYAP